MSATARPSRPLPVPPPASVGLHRPLLALALAMAVLAPVSAAGLVVDPRELAGAPVWAKPLKFSLSVLVYSVSLAWLLTLLQRGRRIAWWAGTATAVLLGVEMVIIVGAAAAGVRSHFNVSTPLATTLWSAMAASIAGAWVAALLVAALLLRAPLGDRARTLAVRAGLLIALLGMALGFLMTSPTPAQLADFRGVAGAHTVGAADGGPGLPLVGWSTVAGDLRIPHFVGMHALQALPLALIAIELLSRRVTAFRDVRVRVRLVAVAAGAYAAMVALVTWQALRGQSIVQPDLLTLSAAAAIAVAALVAVAAILAVARIRAMAEPAAALA